MRTSALNASRHILQGIYGLPSMQVCKPLIIRIKRRFSLFLSIFPFFLSCSREIMREKSIFFGFSVHSGWIIFQEYDNVKIEIEIILKEFKNFPDFITKEQMYKLCHISKKKAEWLLRSGLVPCEHTGRKTRCYIIKKDDVILWLRDYYEDPGKYRPPDDWYKRMDDSDRKKKFGESWKINRKRFVSYLPPEFDQRAAEYYYSDKLSSHKEIFTSTEVSNLTGYTVHTINGWVNSKKLRAIILPQKHVIPKEYLINFLTSDYYNKKIVKKSKKHVNMLWEIYYLSKSKK